MGECGCVGNDERYWFPAPNNHVYLLVISGGCTYCCAPPGVCIELVSKRSRAWKEREWYITGELKFADWHDSKGAAIVTGFERHKFIEAMLPHLLGVDSQHMGDYGVIDKDGAEVIIGEMYDDAMFRPELVEPDPRSKPDASPSLPSV